MADDFWKMPERTKDDCLARAKTEKEKGRHPSIVRYWELRAEGKTPPDAVKIVEKEFEE